MTGWYRFAVVMMIAFLVGIGVDPSFSAMAVLGIVITGLILEFALFGAEKA